MAWVDTTPAGGQQVTVRATAALNAAAYLGGIWGLAARLGRLVPRRVADAAYDVVARHRHRLSPSSACYLPSPSERARFLE